MTNFHEIARHIPKCCLRTGLSSYTSDRCFLAASDACREADNLLDGTLEGTREWAREEEEEEVVDAGMEIPTLCVVAPAIPATEVP